jgi:hypothetical protein
MANVRRNSIKRLIERKKPMKKVFLLLMLLMLPVSQTLAAKWVELKPEEVVSRAQIIVLGTYNFNSKLKSGKSFFYGSQFHVEKVYKGEAAEIITAGIDQNDTGWAEEFQQEGGKFLLFLEKTKEARFLVPVAGMECRKFRMAELYRGTGIITEGYWQQKKESQALLKKKGMETWLKSWCFLQ